MHPIAQVSPKFFLTSFPLFELTALAWLQVEGAFACPRALERMGGETSQLALARCVMRGVLGRERSRARTVEKWRVKTKFCSTYKVHCYGRTVRHFSLPFGSGHLYTICKLSVLNNRIFVPQIKVNICEIN